MSGRSEPPLAFSPTERVEVQGIPMHRFKDSEEAVRITFYDGIDPARWRPAYSDSKHQMAFGLPEPTVCHSRFAGCEVRRTGDGFVDPLLLDTPAFDPPDDGVLYHCVEELSAGILAHRWTHPTDVHLICVARDGSGRLGVTAHVGGDDIYVAHRAFGPPRDPVACGDEGAPSAP